MNLTVEYIHELRNNPSSSSSSSSSSIQRKTNDTNHHVSQSILELPNKHNYENDSYYAAEMFPITEEIFVQVFKMNGDRFPVPL
jgi:hypothetical protein